MQINSREHETENSFFPAPASPSLSLSEEKITAAPFSFPFFFSCHYQCSLLCKDKGEQIYGCSVLDRFWAEKRIIHSTSAKGWKAKELTTPPFFPENEKALAINTLKSLEEAPPCLGENKGDVP